MAQPIAYADEHGFVYPLPVGTVSPHTVAKMIPLYSQEEIDQHLAKFEAEVAAQHGNKNTFDSVDSAKTQVVQAEAVREQTLKVNTGVDLATAAAAKLGMKTK